MRKTKKFDISVEKVLFDSKRLEYDSRFESDSISYKEFIKFFKCKTKLTQNDFIVSSYFSYGWMPTILNLGHSELVEIDQCVELLNSVKAGNVLEEEELELLKKVVNNSIVGVSKLLHFVNPDYYLIWDSRVARYFNISDANKVHLYISYLDYCHNFPKNELERLFKNVCNYESSFQNATKLRALEFVFFNLGRRETKS